MNLDINFYDLPDVLTIADLQRVLQIGRSTAYKLVQTKRLRSVRIGKCIRIPKKFLIEFIKEISLSVE